MNQQATPARPAPGVLPGPTVTGKLPPWDHLPPERRRELTATLATLILNRLARPRREEGRHE